MPSFSSNDVVLIPGSVHNCAQFALDNGADALEPAGVSSLAGSATGRSTTNGKTARASAPSSSSSASASEDLEDLPF